MISNAEIADVIELSGKLFTLHGIEENKAKFYGGIAFGLERLEEDMALMEDAELLKIRGIGKSLLPTVKEIIAKGTSSELEDLIARTPEGVLDMFRVKGLGVKKIKLLWEELGIDNLNDLQIACESGKIAETKGFGEKTQKSILESLQFLKQQSGKLRMNQAKELSEEVQGILEGAFSKIKPIGAIPRSLETVSRIGFLTDSSFTEKSKLADLGFVEDMSVSSPFVWRGHFADNQIIIEIKFVDQAEFGREELLSNAARKHFSYTANGQSFFHFVRTNIFDSPEAYYSGFGVPFIVPEMREGMGEFEWAQSRKNEDLISWDQLRGSLHNHSKYSDGKNSLEEMAQACQSLGLDYFGIADHSQTAAYANGLTAGRVMQQQAEIDELNQKMKPFKILKGIESDILPDGDLDYEKEVLATFDYVVASVHANLDMDIEKATNRLLAAIENPYTTILGHPTGRLLLSRKGYPIDYKKIIDACAANKVVMEINASPYRLDIDWRWIPYCMEKGVMLSVNPDAHKIEGFQDMHYGVAVARKGGLTKDMCFNALSLEEIEKHLAAKK
ncbi:PHP domain-containing protein [Marinilongibacter aquaticus]|uniref:DNA polymerase/3'-5' exonuclease PolX n=1 Tax=Marinilongibacter aquaticus TaxID=2975157 RepID=UPI0021BD46A6|nr:DNA polymerase/3'-5' exonuclease PolX [Marinilongibacter aquaticus]UBM59775.1 PHP domain-containing protein [Marinilongibacter aquaticus]